MIITITKFMLAYQQLTQPVKEGLVHLLAEDMATYHNIKKQIKQVNVLTCM